MIDINTISNFYNQTSSINSTTNNNNNFLYNITNLALTAAATTATTATTVSSIAAAAAAAAAATDGVLSNATNYSKNFYNFNDFYYLSQYPNIKTHHHHQHQQQLQLQQQQHHHNHQLQLQNDYNFISPLATIIQTTTETAITLTTNIYSNNLSSSNISNNELNFTNFMQSNVSELPPPIQRLCPEFYNPNSDYVHFEFWISGIVLNLVGLLGILGNILSMVILSRPQMRSSINYLLIGLARCDTILIITSILLFGIPSIYPYTGYFYYYVYYIHPNISPCLYPIAMAAQTASVYMTFTVTLERYVAVCHPLRARALCTYGRAKIYFIICIIFACLYNIPRFWEVDVITDQLPKINLQNSGENTEPLEENVIFCVVASELRHNDQYINIYIHWCYLVFIYFIPFFSLAILNCLIYRQVQKANRERQRLSRTERREIGLATMLLCVVIVFFVFNFLALYTNILEAFYDIINDYLVKISNLLVTINSSANFIIYVIFGEKFKRIFLLLFCKGRLSRDAPDLIHYESSISNGDGTNRSSGRFSRHGTQRSTTNRNGITTSVRITTTTRIKRNRAPSPGPCVYYPAPIRDNQNNLQRQTAILIPNSSIPLPCDCYATTNLDDKTTTTNHNNNNSCSSSSSNGRLNSAATPNIMTSGF